MTSYIALLRAVNVGGHKPVAMSDLRDVAARLRLGDPRTLLQSGNLVFRSDVGSAADLERLLQSEAARRLARLPRLPGRHRPLAPHDRTDREDAWHPRHGPQLEHGSEAGGAGEP